MNAVLVWFRRDLRDADHAALAHALATSPQVFCAFVFDTDILEALPSRADRRVAFIHASLAELNAALAARAPGAGLIVRHGSAREEIPRLAQALGVRAVHANRDVEPFARERDAAVAAALDARGIAFIDHADLSVFEPHELLTQSGDPYRVFTPYKNAWLRALTPERLAARDSLANSRHLAAKPGGESLPALAQLGFEAVALNGSPLQPGMSGARAVWRDFSARLARYHATRDFPAVRGPSYLSVHLRFGTISIRELARHAHRQAGEGGEGEEGGEGARVWLSELIWREFYLAVLWHFPEVVDQPFQRRLRHLAWDEAPELWQAWTEARTGYPLVDAALRQLHQTGYMHNRLRMVTASFLTKDLGIDWRRGAAHFAAHLNDYDLAANNGGWQWAASTGCDAQPWFRIFNPVTQSRKFDPEGRFIRRYLPELARVPLPYLHAPWTLPPAARADCGLVLGRDYPAPVVDHAQARERTLARFGREQDS